MKMDSHGRPSVSFKVYLLTKFSPLYLIQDTNNQEAAGNFKTKTVACNKFSQLGNSVFVCVERLCWHTREASVLGTLQLCQHSSSPVHPTMLRQLLFCVLFHNILNMADASYQLNKQNLRHILCLCFDYKFLWTAILHKCLKNILHIFEYFHQLVFLTEGHPVRYLNSLYILSDYIFLLSNLLLSKLKEHTPRCI